MTWQPSRIVPGLAQYLAAKGMAPAPIPTETRREAASAGPIAMQLDTTSPQMHPVPECPHPLPHPSPKRKVDMPVQPQPHRRKLSNAVPDDLRSDPATAFACAPATSKSLDDLPPVLRSSLLPFQEEGVRFAIERGGRVMIGDDMGLGSAAPLFIILLRASSLVHHCVLPPQRPSKLSPCAGCCATAGPCSSLCLPACAQHGPRSWSAGCPRCTRGPLRCGDCFLLSPLTQPPHAPVRSSGIDDTDGIDSACIFLVTYDLLTRGESLRQRILLRAPRLVIVDESHYCKNGDAKRTQVSARTPDSIRANVNARRRLSHLSLHAARTAFCSLAHQRSTVRPSCSLKSTCFALDCLELGARSLKSTAIRRRRGGAWSSKAPQIYPCSLANCSRL